MNVVAFERKLPAWRKAELDAMVEAFRPVLALRGASSWEVADTEHGDPQFYLLGPKPDQECILCISRVGQTYIVDDGDGQHIVDLGDLRLLASQVQNLLKHRTARVLAKAVVIWCGAKQAFHEKVDPLMAEGEELLIHFAPQIAALA
jgi:hypothetical protein